MFVYLSKVLPQLLLPVGVSLELLLLGLFLLRRAKLLGQALLVAGVLLLWAAATPLVADRLLGGIEDEYPVLASTAEEQADAIIVLGGGTSGKSPNQPEVELGSSGGRLLYAFRLYRANKAPLLILSGGSLYPGESEAEQMRQILSVWGIPDSAMVLEEKSRNTHENAVDSLALARARGLHRLLLVTSAFHMPRALGIFRHESRALDMQIIPAPTGRFVTRGRPFFLAELMPDAGALEGTSLALRERMGMWIYRRKGWI